MPDVVKIPASRTRSTEPGARRALELVALRGRDVLGVRHVLEGGVAWIGNVANSVARIPMGDYGGQAMIVAEVVGKEFRLTVPPRARARMHESRGLGRLATGPQAIRLGDGDRAVIVLGNVQIRAQIVPVESFSRGINLPIGAAGWIAFVGAIYVAALAVCAVLSPPARANNAPSSHDRGAAAEGRSPVQDEDRAAPGTRGTHR
jgi:hypothetical protein